MRDQLGGIERFAATHTDNEVCLMISRCLTQLCQRCFATVCSIDCSSGIKCVCRKDRLKVRLDRGQSAIAANQQRATSKPGDRCS